MNRLNRWWSQSWSYPLCLLRIYTVFTGIAESAAESWYSTDWCHEFWYPPPKCPVHQAHSGACWLTWFPQLGFLWFSSQPIVAKCVHNMATGPHWGKWTHEAVAIGPMRHATPSFYCPIAASTQQAARTNWERLRPRNQLDVHLGMVSGQ